MASITGHLSGDTVSIASKGLQLSGNPQALYEFIRLSGLQAIFSNAGEPLRNPGARNDRGHITHNVKSSIQNAVVSFGRAAIRSYFSANINSASVSDESPMSRLPMMSKIIEYGKKYVPMMGKVAVGIGLVI